MMSLYYVTYALLDQQSMTCECFASSPDEAITLTEAHVPATACVREVGQMCLAQEDLPEPFEDFGY